MIFVPNSRKALAKISANFYGNPSSRLKLIGVTGTNGKTTITYLLESIFKKARHPVGVIGTINYRYGQTVVSAPNTTPESLDLQRILAEMVEEGITHVIMEVSSHGLDLDRVYGCQFDGAIFTNLTPDHLDYHPTMDHYFESKRKLFSDYLMKSPKTRRFAVTNQDDPRGEAIVEGIDLPVFRYGLGPSCPISADQVTSTFEGLSCRIKTSGGSVPIRSQLIGGFNLYNILAAVANGSGHGHSPRSLEGWDRIAEGVSGRLEKVENQKGIHIFVDYAHTPDALERALSGTNVHSGREPSGRISDRRKDHYGLRMRRGPGSNETAPDGRGGGKVERSRRSSPRTTRGQRILWPSSMRWKKGFRRQAWKDGLPERFKAWRAKKGYLQGSGPERSHSDGDPAGPSLGRGPHRRERARGLSDHRNEEVSFR